MKIIQSEIFKKFPQLGFAFSTKIGLDRKKPFYFNMSKSVGDDEILVEENRKLFFSSIGLTSAQIAFQKQVHEDGIRIVTQAGFQGVSDAMITNKKSIGLAISTADCTPIFIYDKEKEVIAAVHSGWRSTKQKILRKTLQILKTDFNSNPVDLIVYIGPCISQANYEVGDEFANFFNEKYLLPRGDKYLLDLKTANREMLIEFGIEKKNIEVSELCTFEEDFLHSYRREGKLSGRALGVISLI